MRILLFNLATDARDPALGFTARWLAALAARVEFIHVVTMRAGEFDPPANVRVHSVGKEKGYSEPRRALEFYRLMVRLLRRERIEVCFSHMMPLFTVLAAPLLRWKGIPTVTWYAHPSVTPTLKLAHHFSTRMIASLATAYPYKHDKLTAVGQGIDTDLFSPLAEAMTEEPPVILCAGRLSPVKDHPTLLRAAGLLRQRWHSPFRVVIVGGPAAPRDEPYVRSLHEQVRSLDMDGTIRFEPPTTFASLPSWYRRAAVYVNMTPTGSGDKVALEAMACAKLCLTANEGFKETLGEFADHLVYRHGDAEGLAAALQWALSLSETEKRRIGAYLREQVVKMHSLERLMDRLVELFAASRERSPRYAMQLKKPAAY
jgi:glycosyltransferase involved in cell wall biosynthesis